MTTETSGHALNAGGNNNESLMPPGRAGYVGDGDQNYWHALIDEKAAAEFLKLKDRTMQGYRYLGGGPKYVRISSRCLRYRRADLRDWADARIRTSTSDPGKGVA